MSGETSSTSSHASPTRREIGQFYQDIWVDLQHLPDDETWRLPRTHKSYAADFTTPVPHQERLEFLWDAVLDLLVAFELYKRYPEMPESEMTLLKIYLVKESTLAQVARSLDIGRFIRLSRGEAKSWGDQKDAILSDTLEAVLGYLYIHCPMETIENIVKKHIVGILDEMPVLPTKSFKNLFQELIQQDHKELPVYQEKIPQDAEGDDAGFIAEVYAQGKLYGTGKGSNKKKAQENAAKEAYHRYIEQHKKS